MKTSSYILTLLLCCFANLTLFAQNIEFVENKGQWDERVRFTGTVINGSFFVHQNGFTVLQHHADDMRRLHEASHRRGHLDDELGPVIVRSHSYRVEFVNANPQPRITPDKPLNTYNNYFIGNDPSKWGSYCRIFQGITVHDVYPNIDVRYYSDRGTLKYDFIVRPGGNVNDIALRYVGADKLSIRNKELVIATSVGELKELAPYTYQFGEAGKNEIRAEYVLKGDVVRFNVKKFDRNTTLIIDPTLIFCSFSGSIVDNWGFTATYGPDGSMFGGGIVFGNGFPVSVGAYQTNYGGGSAGCMQGGFDIGVIKLTPDGFDRVYATYIGGSGNEMPQSMIVDPQGNLIIGGRTDSPIAPNAGAYPVVGPVGQIVPAGVHGWDVIITKLDAAGASLIGSVRMGGSGNDGANIDPCGNPGTNISLQRNYGDESRSEVNLDAAGNVYLSSCTQSDNFPVFAAFQPNSGGKQDGLIIKLSPDLSVLHFASYFGGSENDAAYVVSVSPTTGEIYIAGGTESPTFPYQTAGTLGPTRHGTAIDGFIAVIANDGSSVLRASFIGTNAIDQIYGIQFDRAGFPYIMGQTLGNWPVTPANVWNQPNGRQFIAKLQPDLSDWVYSTRFGKGAASPDISPVAFLVDRCENVYVSGWGGLISSTHPNSGVQGLPVTADAIKPAPDINPASNLGEDFYFFVLRRNATDQLFGSFFGKNGGTSDHVDGGTSRFDADGVVYQAICASCASPGGLPFTTPGAWTVNKPNSANCNLAMVKIAFNLAGVKSGVQSIIDGQVRDTAGCVPLTVEFVDTVAAGVTYEWNFGDGTPTVITGTPNASHEFQNVGTYTVMLVSVDSTTCNMRDTSYIRIRVGDLRAEPDFNPVRLNPCDSFKYRFDNLTVPIAGMPFNNQSFTWDFGDNSPTETTDGSSVTHTYASPGTYNVRLILHDDRYCNSPDTLLRQIRVAEQVDADFEPPVAGCAPYTVSFQNTSNGGVDFVWDFGDGSAPVQDENPIHTFTNPGTYTVTLIAIDPGTCNVTDTTSFQITVQDNPVADFTASPQPPSVNTAISFNNLSSPDAISFTWSFGDGETLNTTSRSVVQHEYNATGSFDVCLIARNASGCEDTLCRPVETLVDPAVDVPNAFTPGQPGANSVVYVRGYGIAKMKFTVYARWGEKVFETTSKAMGWNGYYKGKLLPMDVYAYTLDVEFSDGTKTRKTGDITLIR